MTTQKIVDHEMDDANDNYEQSLNLILQGKGAEEILRELFHCNLTPEEIERNAKWTSRRASLMEIILEHLNWILMGFFVLLYSMLVILKDVEGKLKPVFCNKIYMGSGMLFVYYIFQISYLEEYEEFEYIIAFLIALTFRDFTSHR